MGFTKLFVLLNIITVGKNVLSFGHRDVICKNTTLDANFDDPNVTTQYQRIYLKVMWDTLPPTTHLLEELRNILLKMVNSDSKFLRDIAFTHSVRMTLSANNASLCHYTRISNASVELIEGNGNAAAAKAIIGIASLIGHMFTVLEQTSLRKSKCKNIPYLEELQDVCYENGLVYPYEKILKYYGELLPCSLRRIGSFLYKSNIYRERANALYLFTSLSELGEHLIQGHPPDIFFENFEIFSTVFPKSCCDVIRQRIDTLNKNATSTALQSAQAIIKEHYSN